MKKYAVRIEYHSVIRDEVEAESEEEAIRIVEDQTSGDFIAIEATQYDAEAREIY